MHIVIIGGGAAGMAAAHYLAPAHQVTVLEKESMLGGNIRTLNKNVTSACIPTDIVLDNGVVEFHRDRSPGLTSLIEDLGLHLDPVAGGSTSLYLCDGRAFHMPGAIRNQRTSVPHSVLSYTRLLWQLRHLVPIGIRMRRSRGESSGSVAGLLRDDVMSKWIRMLLMYGYSIPYTQIDCFPARMAIPTLMQSAIGTRWVRLRGGVYTYIKEIIKRAGPALTVELDQMVHSVERRSDGVLIERSGTPLKADRVVFAVPPDQVLHMLADPDENERRWFSPWQSNYATTIIHTDESIYSAWGVREYTEFDVFEKDGGSDAGYNAYLNRLCGLPTVGESHYFLAYNMEDRIDPRKILHKQRHHTPLYTAEAAQFRDEISAANGRNATCHAGAYLYNGLHEGAIQSALAIRSICCPT